jgi:hypothetical protein
VSRAGLMRNGQFEDLSVSRAPAAVCLP